LKLFQEWEERGIKNDGGSEFNYDRCIVRIFVNVTMYPSTIII
jgi:hypothetical protein